MNNWYLAASLISGATCIIHVFIAGRENAAPLLAADGLGKVPKFTNYYCWHMVSIVLAAQALAFAIASQMPAERSLAIFATGGSIAFTLWSLGMIAIFKLRPLDFPQWAFFAPTSLLGLAGLYL